MNFQFESAILSETEETISMTGKMFCESMISFMLLKHGR